MITSLYLKIPRKVRILVLFLTIMLIAYFIIRFLLIKTRNIPPDFLKAREQASLIASNIVELSDKSKSNIDQIAKLDQEHKYTDALSLVSGELERNNEARQKAINLSNQLEVMAKNLADISPASAGQTALEAISSETTLISRLINYNDYLNQLLIVLRGKFLGSSDGNNVPELIKKLNGETQAINDLNQHFNNKMKQFDAAK